MELLFGDVAPAGIDYTPRFGHEGKVFYIPGPGESPTQIRRRAQIVRSRLGDVVADPPLLDMADASADDMDFETDDDEC